MIPRVLWIEDNAAQDLAYWSAPVYLSGEYELEVALDASDGAARLESNDYDALIVDMRLPPGIHEAWEKLYDSAAREHREPLLGIEILRSLFSPEQASVELKVSNGGLSAQRVGVLTIERYSEIEDELVKLGVKHFEEKKSSSPNTILLEFIRKLLS